MGKIIHTPCDGEIDLDELIGEPCAEGCDEKNCDYYRYYHHLEDTPQEQDDQADSPNIEVVFKKSTGEELNISAPAKPVAKPVMQKVELESRKKEREEKDTPASETAAPLETPATAATPSEAPAAEEILSDFSISASQLSRIEKFRARFQKMKKSDMIDEPVKDKDTEKETKEVKDTKSKKTDDRGEETSELSDVLKKLALDDKFTIKK